ncbi:MAG: S41 family peptidase [bacterium]|nr:S41 family peptidase [bacterium]
MKLRYLLTALIIFIGLSCEEMVLGEEPTNAPESNFEIFWQDFDEHYGLFQARGWNWDSIYNVYRPMVNSQTSDAELWSIFHDMITYLDDSHTFIYNPDEDLFYASGSEDEEAASEVISWDVINNHYLEYSKDASDVIGWKYGKMKNSNIGYIVLTDMDNEDPKIIDHILSELGNIDALIFDIRHNTGGTDSFSARVAGSFADGENLIYSVQEKNGPGKKDFADKTFYYTEPKGKSQFTKPVVVLTDVVTVSAAEVFLLHMKSFEHVTQIGDSTAGDFSDTSMRRFLPNGWMYQYSIMMFLQPDGSSLDGIGHVPDIFIRNTEEALNDNTDLVLDRSLQFLLEEYGIE